MSGKRLTDAQVTSGYERTPGAPNARTLRADHHQAREDREALARLLRACANEHPISGALCWCGDGEVNSYCWGEGSESVFCRERRLLLAEVDP